MNKYFFAILFTVISTAALAQIPGSQPKYALPKSTLPADSLSYLEPKDFIIGGITITGKKSLDKDVWLTISKLNKGGHINLRGEAKANVFKKVYSNGLIAARHLDIKT